MSRTGRLGRLGRVTAALSPLVLLFAVTTAVHAAPAGADTLANCATESPGFTTACGYYITEDGASVLAGENSVTPSVISDGTAVVQTATVEAPTDQAGDGVYSVGMVAFFGTLTGYSPESSPCVNATVEGQGDESYVTWTVVQSESCPNQPFTPGQAFTLDDTTTGSISSGADYGLCASWTSNLGNPGTSCAQDVTGAPGPPPTAGINYHPTGTTANKWTFDGSPSIAGTGSTITNYAWDFGDGTTSPTNSSPTVNHIYASEGNETVTLTVTDADGQTGTTSTTITPALSVTTVSHTPTTIDVGSAFTESVTVENDGTTTITGVTPTAAVTDPTIATLGTSWTPPSADIPPGLSQTFTVAGTGVAQGSTTAAVSAAGTADSATVTAPSRNAALAVAPAALSVSLVNPPTTLSTSQPSTLQVQVTALGSQGATGVTVANPVQTGGDGAFQVVSGPTGADVGFDLATQGSTRTVSFQVEATSPGPITYSVTATGTDTASGDAASASATGSFASIIVTTTGDEALSADQLATGVCDVDPDTAGNQCTLRAAIQLANSLGGNESISFDIPGGGVPDIAPASALPTLQAAITIDGTTEPGGWVQLSGASEGATSPGLDVTGGPAVIRGLVIDGWTNYAGMYVSGSPGTLVAGNRIGTDPSGTSAVPNGAGVQVVVPGVTIGGTSGTSLSSCTGDCNVLSGNGDGTDGSTQPGVDIGPGGSATVQGNYIGTDVTGESALGNGIGVYDVSTASTTTLIGGPTSVTGAAPGNLISGNTRDGLYLSGKDPVTVQGNLIGEDRSGSLSLQPAAAYNPPTELGGTPVGIGVMDSDDPSVVTVGGASPVDRNVIGGFGNVGVAYATTVENDEIGTNPAGTAAIANGDGTAGVSNVVDSLLSGNTGDGVDAAALVQGDRIGTSADGQSALANGYGVTTSHQVGGVRPAGSTVCTDPCNLISGNSTGGVDTGTIVQGNFIGTNLAGTAAIPNGANDGPEGAAVGAATQLGGPSNAVALGVCDQACNLISGNNGIGVLLGATGGANVQGNLIGLDIDLAPLANVGSAVYSQTGNVDGQDLIGGDGDLGNVIAHNGGAAVEVGIGGVEPAVEGNAMIANAGGILLDPGFSGQIPKIPVINTAVRTPGQVAVTGDVTDLITSLGISSRVDLYASASCSDGPQGQVPLGSVTTGLTSNGSFSITAGAVAQSLPYVVATSTESGVTSQFTNCFPISTASTTSPQAGQSVTVQSPGFTPGESVSVTLHSTPVLLETVSANSQGEVDTTVTIPAGTAPGAHELILTGLSSGRVATIPITVLAAATGYDLVGADGGVFALGNAAYDGSEGGTRLNSPIVGMAATPSGGGYWLVGADGGVFSFGDANFYGSEGGHHLNSPIVGMATDPDGGGYWLVAADGGVFSFGDANFYGSEGGTHLNSPIVGMAANPAGNGYWLVAADGGVFSFGDANFYGSEGGTHLNSPIVGMAANPAGNGYWLVGSDGGIFSFGAASFSGSEAGTHLNSPIVGMDANPGGGGYWLVAADGGVFSFGDAAYFGSEGGQHLNSAVVGMAVPS